MYLHIDQSSNVPGVEYMRQGRASSQISNASNTSPQAPKVECSITMQLWCIVQADSRISMQDSGSYKIWSISPSNYDGVRGEIKIRESKDCDSPAELHPKKEFDSDVSGHSAQGKRIAEYSLTSDGSCKLTIEYPIEDAPKTRIYKQLVESRIYLCQTSDCKLPLSSVK